MNYDFLNEAEVISKGWKGINTMKRAEVQKRQDSFNALRKKCQDFENQFPILSKKGAASEVRPLLEAFCAYLDDIENIQHHPHLFNAIEDHVCTLNRDFNYDYCVFWGDSERPSDIAHKQEERTGHIYAGDNERPSDIAHKLRMAANTQHHFSPSDKEIKAFENISRKNIFSFSFNIIYWYFKKTLYNPDEIKFPPVPKNLLGQDEPIKIDKIVYEDKSGGFYICTRTNEDGTNSRLYINKLASIKNRRERLISEITNGCNLPILHTNSKDADNTRYSHFAIPENAANLYDYIKRLWDDSDGIRQNWISMCLDIAIKIFNCIEAISNIKKDSSTYCISHRNINPYSVIVWEDESIRLTFFSKGKIFRDGRPYGAGLTVDFDDKKLPFLQYTLPSCRGEEDCGMSLLECKKMDIYSVIALFLAMTEPNSYLNDTPTKTGEKANILKENYLSKDFKTLLLNVLKGRWERRVSISDIIDKFASEYSRLNN